MDTSVSDALVGRLLSGRYRVGRRLARGGMATVYEALDVRLERTVALKVMHPDLADDAAFVARFTSEARSAAQLSHPDVVAVFDQGEDDGWVYLAMEYVRGRTLRTVLDERGRLDPELTLEVLEHVLSALDTAHRAGIVHRDLKPENVLVATDGRVKVADFGLARAVAGTPSAATRGVLLGTVAYLSPEQALGRPATLRSDVYSLGVMTYELLTGEAPHTGETDYLVVRRHVEVDVGPPSQRVPGIPPVVDDLVRDATARDPEQRYADAGTFLAAVRAARRVLHGLPAEPPTLPRATGPVPPPADDASLDGGRMTAVIDRDPAPLERRRRRGRRLLAMLLVLLLVTGGAGAAYWYGWARWTPAPAVLGLTVTEARSEVEGAGHWLAVAPGRAWSETVPPGRVVTSEPAPGERMLGGAEVVVVLSRGPERLRVPSVGGRSVRGARTILRRAGLAPGTLTPRYSADVPRGRVVEQRTPSGAQVRRGTAVGLVVSRGPEPVDVPDVVGKDAAAARDALARAGLQPASTQAFDDAVPAGSVLSQDPSTGSAARGSVVRLVVSRGPRTVEVPDVTRTDTGPARSTLTALGLEVRVVTVLPVGPGVVLRQDPRSGSSVPAGSTVTLYVF